MNILFVIDRSILTQIIFLKLKNMEYSKHLNVPNYRWTKGQKETSEYLLVIFCDWWHFHSALRQYNTIHNTFTSWLLHSPARTFGYYPANGQRLVSVLILFSRNSESSPTHSSENLLRCLMLAISTEKAKSATVTNGGNFFYRGEIVIMGLCQEFVGKFWVIYF